MLYPLHTRVAKEAGKCLEANNHASSDIFSLWCLLPWGLQSGVSKSKEPRVASRCQRNLWRHSFHRSPPCASLAPQRPRRTSLRSQPSPLRSCCEW